MISDYGNPVSVNGNIHFLYFNPAMGERHIVELAGMPERLVIEERDDSPLYEMEESVADDIDALLSSVADRYKLKG